MNKLTKRVLLALSLLVAPAAYGVSALQPADHACCCGDTCQCADCKCGSGECCCKGDTCPTR